MCGLVSERAEIEAEESERRRLEEMSEDEYDALDEHSKAKVDKKRLEIKKERLKKYDSSYLPLQCCNSNEMRVTS